MQSLTIFAREPVAGRAKTRLCPPLDHALAAALYGCFMRDVCDLAAALPDTTATIAYTPDSDPAFFASFAPTMHARPQRGATLGERMDDALREALADPSALAVLIGSDSPDLPAAHLHEAWRELVCGADVVLGPAFDGGYYLIGVRAPQPRLLREVPMSTPTVLADTLAIAEEMNLRVHLLPPWHDIDTADELWCLKERLREASPQVASATRAFLERVPHQTSATNCTNFHE